MTPRQKEVAERRAKIEQVINEAIAEAQGPISTLWDDFPAFGSIGANILPELTPEQLEDGMTATMDFIAKTKSETE